MASRSRRSELSRNGRQSGGIFVQRGWLDGLSVQSRSASRWIGYPVVAAYGSTMVLYGVGVFTGGLGSHKYRVADSPLTVMPTALVLLVPVILLATALAVAWFRAPMEYLSQWMLRIAIVAAFLGLFTFTLQPVIGATYLVVVAAMALLGWKPSIRGARLNGRITERDRATQARFDAQRRFERV